MNLAELLKKIKALLSKGYASQEEKTAVATAISKLKQEEQEAVGEEAEKVRDLPEKKEGDATEDEEVEKSIKNLFTTEANRVRDELKAYIDEHKDLMGKKAGIYHPEAQAKRKGMSDMIREMTKALLNNDNARLKEMTTDATGSPYAGYTVDRELSAEIRHLITEYGVARREMTAVSLTKNSYDANTLVTDVTVYWKDEAAALLSTQVVLGQKSLTLEKLTAIVTMTSELLEDTEIDLVGFIGERVAEAMARAEDTAFFNGDGTSTYGGFTGLLRNANVNEVVMTGTTFASMDADDLIDMVDKTPAGALANAKFYYHRTIKSIIRKLKTSSTNDYIYQRPSESGPATVWGYPEVLVEAMPAITATAADTSFVLFGDLRKACLLGYKASGLVVTRFNAGVVRNVADSADINLITTDREAVRWTERVGYVVVLPTAVTKLTTAEESA